MLEINKHYQGHKTEQMLQQMFVAHQPEVWIFGHFHKDKQFEIAGTKFVALNELSTFDLKVEGYDY